MVTYPKLFLWPKGLSRLQVLGLGLDSIEGLESWLKTFEGRLNIYGSFQTVKTVKELLSGVRNDLFHLKSYWQNIEFGWAVN